MPKGSGRGRGQTLLSPAGLRERARLGGLALSAKVDPVANTQKARDTWFEHFLDEVDPDGSLRRERPEEAKRRAIAARKFHMRQLAYRRARTREKNAAEKKARAGSERGLSDPAAGAHGDEDERPT